MKNLIVIIFLFFVTALSAQEHRVWILFRNTQKTQRTTEGRTILHNDSFNHLTNALQIGTATPVFPYSKNDTLLRLFEITATNEQINVITNISDVEDIISTYVGVPIRKIDK